MLSRTDPRASESALLFRPLRPIHLCEDTNDHPAESRLRRGQSDPYAPRAVGERAVVKHPCFQLHLPHKGCGERRRTRRPGRTSKRIA